MRDGLQPLRAAAHARENQSCSTKRHSYKPSSARTCTAWPKDMSMAIVRTSVRGSTPRV